MLLYFESREETIAFVMELLEAVYPKDQLVKELARCTQTPK